eukprot:TRINITY_DN1106_c0_g1_i2.p1 TRINITY_DN1106_c0_g1~~TRINITY_DN1106_c0_g1_i2.p1  ORF type:complete len:567 (-),score=104.92 TRINITY_DN1106_c0_g1_i2:90-1790(-)
METGRVENHYLVHRDDYVRLILQALGDLGFNDSVAALSKESDIQLQSKGVEDFCSSVMAGDWDKAISLLTELRIHKADDYQKVKFLIFEQKYLELLEQQQTVEALECLRNNLSLVQVEPERLQKLTGLLIYTSPDLIRSRHNWDGAGEVSRKKLLHNIRIYVQSSIMLPDRRLESLILQAFEYQKSTCLYHNSQDSSLSLFQDHKCTREQIPTETKYILDKHTSEVWHIEFSHDGRFLASASKDKTVIIWAVSNSVFTPVHTLSAHTKPIANIAWSPDDSMLLTTSYDKKIKLWDTRLGTELFNYSSTDCHLSVSWMPDGKQFISGGLDNRINLWDTEGRLVKIWRWIDSQINDCIITKDGKWIIAVAQSSKIHLIRIADETRDVLVENSFITSMQLSDDGKLLLVNMLNQEVHVWDLETRKLLNKYRGQKRSKYVIRSCFGGFYNSFVVSGSEDCVVNIWQRNHGILLESLKGHKGTVNSVTWNPKNPYQFASASDDGTIRIWETNLAAEYYDLNSSDKKSNVRKRGSDVFEEKGMEDGDRGGGEGGSSSNGGGSSSGSQQPAFT